MNKIIFKKTQKKLAKIKELMYYKRAVEKQNRKKVDEKTFEKKIKK